MYLHNFGMKLQVSNLPGVSELEGSVRKPTSLWVVVVSPPSYRWGSRGSLRFGDFPAVSPLVPSFQALCYLC